MRRICEDGDGFGHDSSNDLQDNEEEGYGGSDREFTHGESVGLVQRRLSCREVNGRPRGQGCAVSLGLERECLVIRSAH